MGPGATTLALIVPVLVLRPLHRTAWVRKLSNHAYKAPAFLHLASLLPWRRLEHLVETSASFTEQLNCPPRIFVCFHYFIGYHRQAYRPCILVLSRLQIYAKCMGYVLWRALMLQVPSFATLEMGDRAMTLIHYQVQLYYQIISFCFTSVAYVYC
jgi:hypothetical protein